MFLVNVKREQICLWGGETDKIRGKKIVSFGADSFFFKKNLKVVT